MDENAQPSGTAKIVTALRARPGHDSRMVAWNGRVVAALEKSAGYAGREVVPPQTEGLGEWLFVTRFETLADAVAWRRGAACAQLRADIADALEIDGYAELAGEAAARFHVENSVTEVIIEEVRAGCEDRYRAWSSRMEEAQAKLPGYQGGYTQPPPTGSRHWTTLLRFATVDDLNRWLASPERQALLREAAPLVERAIAHRVNTAFPGWAPTDAASGKPPPDWKTTMLVLLGLYPIVAIEIAWLMQHLAGLKPAVAGFIGNAISVTLVAYGTMPLLVRWMGWWLFPRPEVATRLTLLGVALIAVLYAIEIAVFWNVL
ncbi:MAG: hypothetical protein U1F10_09035 [Burkholderiales bacterium]